MTWHITLRTCGSAELTSQGSSDDLSIAYESVWALNALTGQTRVKFCLPAAEVKKCVSVCAFVNIYFKCWWIILNHVPLSQMSLFSGSWHFQRSVNIRGFARLTRTCFISVRDVSRFSERFEKIQNNSKHYRFTVTYIQLLQVTIENKWLR